MTYLLDTNVCIALLKGRPAQLEKKVSSVRTNQAVIPAVVRYELHYGARKSNQPKRTLAKLGPFLRSFPSLAFDDFCADICGRIRATLERAGTPIGPYDLMIAALAVQNDLILVTRNVREFQRVEAIRVENWED